MSDFPKFEGEARPLEPLTFEELWEAGHKWSGSKLVKRVMACVNACAGMDDPQAEIAAMKRRITELEARTNPG